PFIDGQKRIGGCQAALKEQILKELHNSTLLQKHFAAPRSLPGGLIGVVGNHDVGTIKAKVMLDIAYNRALSNSEGNPERIEYIENTYKKFKDENIKGISNTDELMNLLQSSFALNDMEKRQLFADVNMRMREKIFIASMMCTG